MLGLTLEVNEKKTGQETSDFFRAHIFALLVSGNLPSGKLINIISYGKWTVLINDLPIKMVIFHSQLLVYWRVCGFNYMVLLGKKLRDHLPRVKVANEIDRKTTVRREGSEVFGLRFHVTWQPYQWQRMGQK